MEQKCLLMNACFWPEAGAAHVRCWPKPAPNARPLSDISGLTEVSTKPGEIDTASHQKRLFVGSTKNRGQHRLSYFHSLGNLDCFWRKTKRRQRCFSCHLVFKVVGHSLCKNFDYDLRVKICLVLEKNGIMHRYF